jgi:hypothetical protein
LFVDLCGFSWLDPGAEGRMNDASGKTKPVAFPDILA